MFYRLKSLDMDEEELLNEVSILLFCFNAIFQDCLDLDGWVFVKGWVF